jgi:hypothetical protein
MKQILAILTVVLMATCRALAGEKMSDAEIKQKLLGYWKSPRHGYLIKSDGVMYMLPRASDTTANRWDVRNGVYYEDSDPFDIVTLTVNKFVYRDRGHDHATYTLQRISKEEAEK